MALTIGPAHPPRAAGGRQEADAPVTTVILAEPEASARWVRTREFEAAGFTVLPAADEAALDRALAQGDPEALVVDRRLVGPAGEWLRRLRQDPRPRRPESYVLALVPSGPERQALLEAGAAWYIDKTALASGRDQGSRRITSTCPCVQPSGRGPGLQQSPGSRTVDSLASI